MRGTDSGVRFTSENSRGNQHAKGNPPNKTSFKAGVNTMENSKSWKGGVQHNKNDVVYLAVDTNKRIRRPKYIYEQVYGELPKGYIIYHIDGNKENDNIDNLEAITRRELLMRNRI